MVFLNLTIITGKSCAKGGQHLFIVTGQPRGLKLHQSVIFGVLMLKFHARSIYNMRLALDHKREQTPVTKFIMTVILKLSVIIDISVTK